MQIEDQDFQMSNILRDYTIEPHDYITVIKQDTGIIPGAHRNVYVDNVGRTEVYAELKYGTKFNWFGTIVSATVNAGEKKTLTNGGRPYYVTALRVYNNTDTRALVHCDTVRYLHAEKRAEYYNDVWNDLLKAALGVGLKQIPYVGSALAGIVNAFWPKSEPNIWEQIQDKVKALLDEKILETIGGLLSGDIRYYQQRITTLSEEMEAGENPEELRVHYMNIAQDMIGFENKFRFTNDISDYQNTNQFILPHFSTFVLMKISFYMVGIRESKVLGLSELDVKNISNYANKTIYDDNGANNYINELYKDRVDNAYNSSSAEEIFDSMMNVRAFIGVHGREYILLWNYMLENTFSDTNPYNDVISYSTFYGRQTADLVHQATALELQQPLTPKLINGKRNKIASIVFYIWRIYGTGPARIGGQQVNFENGDTHTSGTVSNETNTIEFKGSTLKKLEAYGSGAVDYLVFHFADGRTETSGNKAYHNYHTIFELKDHHIASMFIASDAPSLGGQAANIAVSYQLDENLSQEKQ